MNTSLLVIKKIRILFIAFFSLILIGASCEQNKNQENKVAFLWGKPLMKVADTESFINISDTHSPDGRILSIICDSCMIRVPQNTSIDSSFKFILEIPVAKTEQANYDVSNDLRYFLSKDSLTSIKLNIVVNNQKFDINIPEGEFETDSIYTYNYKLNEQFFNHTDLKVRYIFNVTVLKDSTAGEVLLQFNTLDIGAKEEKL